MNPPVNKLLLRPEMEQVSRILFVGLALAAFSSASSASAAFVNFESPQVHPVDLSPDGATLAVCNTADNRIEFFDVQTGTPQPLASIPVGLDPVSVRFFSDTVAWAVNQISDSVSVIDLEANVVIATLATSDEPADVVFGGAPLKAFVSCSQADSVLVFDPANLSLASAAISIAGEDPRALAVSPDGTKVYVAVFESGNDSTILGGGLDGLGFPPNVVSNPAGPYSGVNPPPNDGAAFNPPKNPANPDPPKVGLIVKRDAGGLWRDDNGTDWTSFVSGPQAALSGRPVGWDLIDNDVAIIDAASHAVSYAEGLMNICMAIGVNPATGKVTVVGTDCTNEIRFEPLLEGKFLRVNLGMFSPAAPAVTTIKDLNSHLTYAAGTVAQVDRDRSLGDPRGIVWKGDGSRGYVTGMGSNNVLVLDGNGDRAGIAETIAVGEGPTGLAIDDGNGVLYVLNRFEASISVIDLTTELETARVPFFDPTPAVIKTGRKHLFDTHKTSGLGHVSCASCHVDARMDRLAWDLGNPAGDMKEIDPEIHNLSADLPGLNDPDDYSDFHPMKGPMTTQTLQGIIGKEPHHWRGDRDGLEEFNQAFMSLLGDDEGLTTQEMQEFEDYLATIHFPPNPFRNLDNTLPTSLPLPGHFTSGRFAAAGQPMPNGNAQRALEDLYRPLNRGIDGGALACVTCHALPTGIGTDTQLDGAAFVPFPPGPNGERHHALVSIDGSTQRALKVPHLRNMYDKVGFEMTQATSRAGFGFIHDGSVDSLSRFLAEPVFTPNNDQEIADLVALMLAFTGSGYGAPVEAIEPPGTASEDAHTAVGRQVSRTSSAAGPAHTLMTQLLALADAGAVDVIVKSAVDGVARGWLYTGGNQFQTDQASVQENLASLLARATALVPATFTAVAGGCGQRIGLDREEDGLFDFDEVRDLVPEIVGVQNPFSPDVADSTGNNGSASPDGVPDGMNDFDGDGISNAQEMANGTNPAGNLAIDVSMELAIALDGAAASTAVTLSWQAAPLGVYRVSYSHDLVAWTESPTGEVAAGDAGGQLEWTDDGPPATTSAPGATEKRFYKVERVK